MIENPNSPLIKRIAFVGNYLPRQCGIATFTTDLCEAIAAEYPETSCMALPVNDTETGYAYPPRVRFELTEKDIDFTGARRIFSTSTTSTWFGCSTSMAYLAGGRAAHILTLLRELRMPVVTTLHTILRESRPGPAARARGSRRALRPAGGHERARRAIPAGDLRRGGGEDRSHPARHPGRALRRPQFPQGPLRGRGQDRAVELRPALVQQGHRERHLGAARDPGAPSERGIHRARRHAPPCPQGKTARPTGSRCNGWRRRRASRAT